MTSARGSIGAEPGGQWQRTAARHAGLAILTVTVLVGCDGSGSVGPTGPEGESAVEYVAGQGVIGSSGAALLSLPASVTADNLPIVSCYISDDGQTWLSIDGFPSSASGPTCGLVGVGTATPGVIMINVIPGYRWYISAVF